MVSKTATQSVGGGFVKTNPNNSKIKQIVEATRCSRADAEDALNEAGGELEGACLYILDHAGDNAWAVKTKGRKVTNKKSETGAATAAEAKPQTKKAEPGAAPATTGGQMKQDRPPRAENGRGERRGGGNFRGGRGGGNRPGWNKKSEPGAAAAGATAATTAPAEVKPDETQSGGESGAAAPPATTTTGEVKQERPPRTDHGRGERRGGGPYRGGNHHRGSGHRPAWKGPQTFTRTDQKAASPAATTEATQSPPMAPTPVPVQPEVIKTAAGPLSFAAVCAAGVKKPELPPSPTTSTQASSGLSPDANVGGSEPQQDVETTPFEAEKESSAEVEDATPEVRTDDEALPEASGELEAANQEIQSETGAEETLQETADEPKVPSTPDHLEQIGQNAWAEKFYMEKAAPPVVEMRRPVLDFSETHTLIVAPEKPVMKSAAVSTYTPVSTPSTPAVFNGNAMPAGFAHSSYYHPPQAPQVQVQQPQQQPVLPQSQQQQMYNPLHYASYVPPPPGLSGPNNHLYHNQQYPNMHYYAMQMGHQMYPTGNAANTNQVQNRRYDTNQHSGGGHNNMQQHHYQWNS